MEENKSLFCSLYSYIAHVDPETKGKQNIVQHIEDALKLSKRRHIPRFLRKLLAVTLILHDAGKVNKVYILYMKDLLKYGRIRKRAIDHSTAGGRILEAMQTDPLFAELAIIAIYFHHGIRNCIELETGYSLLETRRKKKIPIQEIENKFFSAVDREELESCIQQACQDVRELAEKISAGKEKEAEAFCLGMTERLLLAFLMNCDWTSTECFSKHKPVPEEISESEVQKIWENCIKNYESRIEEEFKEYWALDFSDAEELTGQLKIIASQEQKIHSLINEKEYLALCLGFAFYHAKKNKKNHIIYVCPENSLVEERAEQIQKYVQDRTYVRQDSWGLFWDEGNGKVYKKYSENFHHPIIVTTMEELLAILFSDDKSSLRWMGSLCDSILIFEDIQELPVECVKLFQLAADFLSEFCGATIVLNSAEEPELLKICGLQAFRWESLTDKKTIGPSINKYISIEDKTELMPGGMEMEDLKKFVIEKQKLYKKILILVNTENCAKQIYLVLKESGKQEADSFHFSSAMCQKNIQNQKEIMKQKDAFFCVSTGGIKMNEDMFDCVICSLSDLSFMIRAERYCHGTPQKEGKLYLIKMSMALEAPEEISSEIREAQEVCREFLYYYRQAPSYFKDRLDSELSVKGYYTIFYKKIGKSRMRYPDYEYDTDLVDLLGQNKRGRNQFARAHQYMSLTPVFLAQAFKRAGERFKVSEKNSESSIFILYDEKIREIFSKLKEEKFSPVERRNVLRKLQDYSVRISPKQKRKLEHGLVYLPEWGLYELSMEYYDEKTGVCTEKADTRLKLQIQGVK